MSIATRIFMKVAVLGLTELSVSNAGAGKPGCLHLPNGDFTEGTTGWTINFETSNDGEAGAGTNAAVVDGSQLIDPLDENALRLDAYLYTGSRNPQFDFGEANAEVTASCLAPITNRYLKLRIGGGFEWSNYGGAGILTHASVRVRPTRSAAGGPSPEVVHVIRNSDQPGIQGCGFHLNVLGVFANQPPIAIDIFEQDGKPTGFSIGHEVVVEVVIRIASVAAGECQGSDLYLALFVDEFGFCENENGGGVRGDITGDGAVNVDDLLAVIHHWGLCPLPVGGIEGCRAADIAPPGPPAGDGTVNVDDLLIVINNWDD